MMNLQTIETVESSDTNLVSESLTGNREAFGRIVARYQTLICSLTFSSTGSLSQSEDLAQETFLAAWKQLGSLREPEKLRGWLCGIARNLTFDALKQQGREPSHDAETLDAVHELPSPEPEPDLQAMSREEEALLWRALQRLPLVYREALTLYYREHRSIVCVAEALDLNEDAVKQRLSRGRKLLHEQVLAFVEGALERTAPGNGFTASVLSALPATFSAKAAGMGVAGAKAATATGLVKSLLVLPLAVLGNYFGYRVSMDSAQSDLERDFIKGFYKRLVICVVGFSVVFSALLFWSKRDGSRHEQLGAALVVGLAGAYGLATIALGFWQLRKRRALLARLHENGQFKPVRAAWEYRSKAVFLGMPLVHIRIGGRASGKLNPVRAWIAAGDYAIGGLFAFAGMAIAPVSIGGVAIGLLPFGGCAIGLLTLGGFAVGIWSFGGLAIGWESFGGCAVAWNAACGGAAVAWNYALGGIASAAQTNNDIAEAFCKSQRFFRVSSAILPYCGWLNLLWVLPMAQWWRVNRRAAKAAAALAATLLLIISGFSIAAQPATDSAAFDPAPRFDDLVRDDFFSGDSEKLKHGIKICEDFLAKNPQHAPAMVWHGAGLIGMSAEPFQKGDFATGMELWSRGLKEMDAAVALQPDSLQTLIPRGATLLGVAKYTPDLEARKKMIQTGVGDYEKVLQLQTSYFTKLSTHSRGELLFGLADGWYRVGETNKSIQYLRRVVHDLPDTKYAERAQDWLQTTNAAALNKKSNALQCLGCHER